MQIFCFEQPIVCRAPHYDLLHVDGRLYYLVRFLRLLTEQSWPLVQSQAYLLSLWSQLALPAVSWKLMKSHQSCRTYKRNYVIMQIYIDETTGFRKSCKVPNTWQVNSSAGQFNWSGSLIIRLRNSSERKFTSKLAATESLREEPVDDDDDGGLKMKFRRKCDSPNGQCRPNLTNPKLEGYLH